MLSRNSPTPLSFVYSIALSITASFISYTSTHRFRVFHPRYMERGSLYNAIKKETFTVESAKLIMREILLGLNYVHGKGIIHR